MCRRRRQQRLHPNFTAHAQSRYIKVDGRIVGKNLAPNPVSFNVPNYAPLASSSNSSGNHRRNQSGNNSGNQSGNNRRNNSGNNRSNNRSNNQQNVQHSNRSPNRAVQNSIPQNINRRPPVIDNRPNQVQFRSPSPNYPHINNNPQPNYLHVYSNPQPNYPHVYNNPQLTHLRPPALKKNVSQTS